MSRPARGRDGASDRAVRATGPGPGPAPAPDRKDSTMGKDSKDADVKLAGNGKDGKLRLSDHG